MSLHPFIELKVDDKPIGSVPAEHIKSLEYKTSTESLDTIQMSFIDPYYTKIEELLLDADKRESNMFVRFGYPDSERTDKIKIVRRDWSKFLMVNFTPSFTGKGMEIVMRGIMDVKKANVDKKVKAFRGKVSEIVTEIAGALDMNAEVEETSDDVNTKLKSNRDNPKSWPTENHNFMEFIRRKLLPVAVNSEKLPYIFWVDNGDGNDKPTLHFHTRSYDKCKNRKGGVRKLTYLAGAQDKVLSFQPDYNSKILGHYGPRNYVGRVFDSRTGQFVSKALNVETANLVDSISTEDVKQTIAVPLNEDDPKDTSKAEIICQILEQDIGTADARCNRGWNELFASTATANLELVGLPEFVTLNANELIDMTVLMPIPGKAYEKHRWSGGIYQIVEAVHQINTGYRIMCRLRRDFHNLGVTTIKAEPGRTSVGLF